MKKSFWDRTAFLYDRFMRKDFAAYEKMYALIRPAIREKDVLELATGTGAVAKTLRILPAPLSQRICPRR